MPHAHLTRRARDRDESDPSLHSITIAGQEGAAAIARANISQMNRLQRVCSHTRVSSRRSVSQHCGRLYSAAAASATAADDLPPVRLALWGCGGVAEAHLNAATKFNLPIEVTALVDTNPARIPIVAALADGPCTPYDTIEDALAQAADEIDVIAIFLPHNIHESSTIQMLRTGKHVFLEKPMAPSVEVRTDSATAHTLTDCQSTAAAASVWFGSVLTLLMWRRSFLT
eukprot:COSAG06_NODE_12199_length_1410_cov_1.881770_3_plen_228_part_00